MIELSAPHEVVGHGVVCNESETPRETMLHEVIEELLLQRLLLQLDEHTVRRTLSKSIKALIRVVRTDAAIEQLCQLPSDEARTVSLDGEIWPAVLNLADQTIRLGVRVCNDLATVHHLAEADHLIHVHERFDIITLNRSTCCLKRIVRRGDGGRNGDSDIDGTVLRTLHQCTDPLHPINIRDLMRLCDERCDAAAHCRVHKCTRRTHRAFDVHMAIDQSRNDILSAEIDRTLCRMSRRLRSNVGKSIPTECSGSGDKRL